MEGVEKPGKSNTIANRQSEDARLAFEQLVERATQGDQDALCNLCEKIAKSVLFQVTHFLGGGQDGVEDVSQEVLVRVCENIGDLRSAKAFKVWLSRIIINEKNRYLAKNAKRTEVLNIEDYLENITEDNGEFLPQECAESAELRRAVMDIIDGLSMRQREAILLYYYEGLSVTQIAEAMEVTVQSASKHLILAREKLRRALRESTLDGRV